MGIRAIPQTEQPTVSLDHSPHFVWMAGGPSQIDVSGVGEQAVGFDTLPRRTLREIIPIRVGARIETVLGESALADPNFERQRDNWTTDPRRVQTKSARAICQELLATYAEGGLVVIRSLVGKDFDQADELVESIVDSATAEKPLVEVLKHLRSVTFDLNDPRFVVHAELLTGCERAYTYLNNCVQSLKTEVGAAMQAGRPMRPLSPVEKELFVEIAETLPEDLLAKRNAELGVQIARSVSENSAASNNDRLATILERMDERLVALETKKIEVAATAESKSK